MSTICCKCKRLITKDGATNGPAWLGKLWELVDSRLSHGICEKCLVVYRAELKRCKLDRMATK
jgi:hypothetical protein